MSDEATLLIRKALRQGQVYSPPTVNPLEQFVRRFQITDDMVSQMEQAEIIWNDVLVSGHVQVWASKPNGGKTTIAMLAASELASKYDVYFLQEDAGAGDLPALKAHANLHGYSLLNSMLASSTTEAMLEQLKGLRNVDLSNHVFIFDTLKKFADVMSKRGAPEFFKLMRGLSTLGATVVLLGHTNKHLAVDGKPVFEGVGDVRSDVDELFYLLRTDSQNDECLVQFEAEKCRAAVGKPTFKINTQTRAVWRTDVDIDVAALARIQEQRRKDADIIEAVNQRLRSGTGTEAITSLARAVSEAVGCGINKAQKVIKRHSSPNDVNAIWLASRLFAHNEIRISLKP